MHRKRLKSSSGCTFCRARHKKCDETKPTCKICNRLGRRCSYLDPNFNRASPHLEDPFDMPVVTEEFLSSFSDTAPAVAARTADHSVWWQTITPDEDGIMTLFDADTPHRLASTVSNLESIIISGVWRGWASLLPSLQIPQRVVDLDKHLQSAGHGIIARTVFMYYNCLLDDYISANAQSPLSSCLPMWSIVRSTNLPVDETSSETLETLTDLPPEQVISLYIPWPAARTRVQREPFRYCSDRFFRHLWKSTRFIWPFAAADAIHTNDHGGQYSFSAELLLRISNIRSFPATKDFLDTYTEFRGEVPQLEPSPTWYRPEDQRRWEAVFWAKLREERLASKKKASATKSSRSTQALWVTAKRRVP